MNFSFSCRALLWASLAICHIGLCAADPPARSRPPKFDETLSREDVTVQEALKPLLSEVARSTVRVLREGRGVALAVAVHEAGWLVSKASELEPRHGLQVEFSNGLRLPTEVTDVLPVHDLALLKINASGLIPVTWSDAPAPTPGSFLMAAGPDGSALALGVTSVAPRSLYETPRGFLGVSLRKEDRSAAIIDAVHPDSAASLGGLKEGDVVLAVEGQPVRNSDELVADVSARRPGEEVTLKVRRGELELELNVTLMNKRDFIARYEEASDPMVMMGGRLSRHRYGFFNVLQHDLVLAPEDCGGALVDLEGHVVGLNIARSGRVESLAIPAADLKPLLARVEVGKFTLPDPGSLRDELKQAELAVLNAQEARQEAAERLRRATELIETLPRPKKVRPLASEPSAMPTAPATQAEAPTASPAQP